MKSLSYRLQFITHYTDRYTYLDSARMALEGGCRWVQLRMKGAETSLMEHTAIVVRDMCRGYGATFIIDDDVMLVKRIGADGVHLGKEDMSVAEARALLGEGYIIGATVNTMADIEAHMRGVVPDYFGCGPYRFTQTKERLAPMLGIEGYRAIIAQMRAQNIMMPLVAIGGIEERDIPLLLDVGVDGIALSGSVLRAENPISEMRKIAELVEAYTINK